MCWPCICHVQVHLCNPHCQFSLATFFWAIGIIPCASGGHEVPSSELSLGSTLEISLGMNIYQCTHVFPDWTWATPSFVVYYDCFPPQWPDWASPWPDLIAHGSAPPHLGCAERGSSSRHGNGVHGSLVAPPHFCFILYSSPSGGKPVLMLRQVSQAPIRSSSQVCGFSQRVVLHSAADDLGCMVWLCIYNIYAPVHTSTLGTYMYLPPGTGHGKSHTHIPG